MCNNTQLCRNAVVRSPKHARIAAFLLGWAIASGSTLLPAQNVMPNSIFLPMRIQVQQLTLGNASPEAVEARGASRRESVDILLASSKESIRPADYALPRPESSSSSRDTYHAATFLAVTPAEDPRDKSFRWRSALEQSFAFLMFEHGVRILREPSTRKQLPGKFWKDYCDSVLGLDGWRDGDPFYVNYVGHPMQGAVVGYIQIQNDPKGRKLEFNDPGYWQSRSKAMLWNAAYSVQFEIGPISEASLGNVGRGIDPRTGRTGAAAVDLVITPTVGAAWLVGEDILDRYVVRSLEGKTRNRYLKSVVRGLLNPDRAMANMLAGKVPWHRDTRGPIWNRRIAVGKDSQPDDRVGTPSGAIQGLN